MERNLRKLYFYCLAYLLTCTAQAQELQMYTSVKTGVSSMETGVFRRWASEQRTQNAVGRADNALIGWHIGATFDRVIACFDFDYDLGSNNASKPRTSLFMLGGGYCVWKKPRFNVNVLGSIGGGNMVVKFKERDQVPLALLPYHSPNSFAKQGIWAVQPALSLTFKPRGEDYDEATTDDHTGFFVSFKTGMNFPLGQSGWKYGDLQNTASNTTNGSSTVFVGRTAPIPKFYEKAFFVQLGIGFIIENW